MKKLIVFCLSGLLYSSASFAGLPCGATGFVGKATPTFKFESNQFINAEYYWYENYHARILKTVIGTITDGHGNILEQQIKMDLISESDSRGCDVEIQWVRDEDFVRVP